MHQAADLSFRLESEIKQFFSALTQYLFEQREGRPVGAYAQQERILPSTRTQPGWGMVELAWEDAAAVLKPLIEMQSVLLQAITELTMYLIEADDLFSTCSNLYRRMVELYENMDAMVFNPDTEKVYWVEAHIDGVRHSLHAAPLHIGQLMQRYLWHEKTSVILTSATLAAANEFDYLRGRLYAEDAYELALGSPFDYESSALVYIVNDIPEPGDRQGHQRAVETALINLCQAIGGRTLALFTSYDQTEKDITGDLSADTFAADLDRAGSQGCDAPVCGEVGA